MEAIATEAESDQSAEFSPASDEYSVKKRRKNSVANATQKSLQELAMDKALSEILQPSFQDSDFEALEPRLQRLLFSGLRSHLQQIPEADVYLSTPAAQKRLTPRKSDDSASWQYHNRRWMLASKRTGCWGGSRDVYWGVSQDEPEDSSSHTWNSNILFYDREQPEPNFVLMESLTPREVDLYQVPWTVRRPGRLSQCISSQLLQYRLTATFSMMLTQDVVSEEVCWETYLSHRDKESIFHLYDTQGTPGCEFRGSEEAHFDALILLSYLCGKNVWTPDPSSGLLAGTSACHSKPDLSGGDVVTSKTSISGLSN